MRLLHASRPLRFRCETDCKELLEPRALHLVVQVTRTC